MSEDFVWSDFLLEVVFTEPELDVSAFSGCLEVFGGSVLCLFLCETSRALTCRSSWLIRRFCSGNFFFSIRICDFSEGEPLHEAGFWARAGNVEIRIEITIADVQDGKRHALLLDFGHTCSPFTARTPLRVIGPRQTQIRLRSRIPDPTTGVEFSANEI